MNPNETEMATFERYLVIASLINAAIFYVITIIMFIIARRTSLNWALAGQKTIWLLIITFIALPSVLNPPGFLSYQARVVLWVLLAISTWFVLYEVYKSNWPGPFTENVRELICNARRIFRRGPKC